MKSTGVVRRIDELGRIVIPKEIRRNLGIRDGENVEIFTEYDSIILKKYNRMEKTSYLANMLCEIVYNEFNYKIMITDREKIIASSGVDQNVNNKNLLKEELNLIENRETITKDDYILNLEGTQIKGSFVFIPIISLNDSIGLVIMYSPTRLSNESAIGKFISSIFSRKLDI